MAKGNGVVPHRWQFCATCKRENPKRKKPTEGCKRCKVTAWRVFYRDPEGTKGSQVFDCAKVPNAYDEAVAFKAGIVTSKRNGTYVDPNGSKVLFLTQANEWAGAQDWKEGTELLWPTRRRRLERYVGKKATLGSLTKTRLLTIRKNLAKDYARNTVAGTMYLIMAILRSAVADGLIARDPTVGVDAAPKKRADDPAGGVNEDKVPTSAEACAILGAAPDQYRAGHALGLAGLRISEALGMGLDRIVFPDDIDPTDLDALAALPNDGVWADNVQLVVNRQLVDRRGGRRVFTTPKAEKVRTIKAPRLVALELRDHLVAGYGGWWTDEDGNDHYMLFMRDGRPVIAREFYVHGWNPAVKAAGMTGRFTFHGYRHHVASKLLAQGASLAATAGYIGDHQYTVMRVYAHWLRDDVDVPPSILNGSYDTTVVPLRKKATTAPRASRKRQASRMPHAA